MQNISVACHQEWMKKQRAKTTATATRTLSMPRRRVKLVNFFMDRDILRGCVDFAGLFGCPASSTSSIDAADATAAELLPRLLPLLLLLLPSHVT